MGVVFGVVQFCNVKTLGRVTGAHLLFDDSLPAVSRNGVQTGLAILATVFDTLQTDYMQI